MGGRALNRWDELRKWSLKEIKLGKTRKKIETLRLGREAQGDLPDKPSSWKQFLKRNYSDGREEGSVGNRQSRSEERKRSKRAHRPGYSGQRWIGERKAFNVTSLTFLKKGNLARGQKFRFRDVKNLKTHFTIEGAKPA